jgi:hypothetical protein
VSSTLWRCLGLVLRWVNESTTGRRAGCWAAVDPLTGRPSPQQPAPRGARFSWTALIVAVLAAAALVMAVISLIRPTPTAIPASAPITTTPAPAPIPPVSITSAVATSGTGQTQVVSLSIPAKTLAVGTTFAIKAFGVQNATAATAVIFQIHLGPSNTTSDPIVSSSGEAAAANGGIATDGMLTIRTTGSSGTTTAGIVNTITNGATTSTTTTTQTVDTTADNFLTLSVSTSAGVHTIEVAAISVVKA